MNVDFTIQILLVVSFSHLASERIYFAGRQRTGPALYFSMDDVVVVVVHLPRPMEGNGVTSIFRSYRTASSTTGGWSRWYIFNVLYIYIILSTTVSHFWTLRMPCFTRSPFFVYISILQVHFACVLCI